MPVYCLPIKPLKAEEPEMEEAPPPRLPEPSPPPWLASMTPLPDFYRPFPGRKP